jgi:pantoate--beta-alanine ligase
MKTVRAVEELRSTLAAARRAGRTVGLVPTMGALHDGHLSLIVRARRECDVVVVSLFVNPSQFDERTDLERYPREQRRDAELASEAGADVLFAPSVEEVYPPGFATSVEVLALGERLEGVSRGSEHFRAVGTVVTKLLGMAQPDVAYFGQKDAQQLVVIRRLVADLNLPVRVQACPTVRERDGLAMSSRNARLDPEERARAVALSEGLRAAAQRAADGERSAAALLDVARAALLARGVEPEYLELVDPDTLAPREQLTREALLAVAARIGQTRLIDNAILRPSIAPVQGEPVPDAGPTPETPHDERHQRKAIARCNA